MSWERNERCVWGYGPLGCRAEPAIVLCGDGLSLAKQRSSIRASLLSMAEGFFLHEVGSVQLAQPNLTNNKRCQILV
jgi:hypothetical protein